ncbi:hypothetical protein JCM3774_003466 [Rhodotorula dairenensis]
MEPGEKSRAARSRDDLGANLAASQVVTPAGTLFLLDPRRTFAYLSALGGLVFIAGSAFWLLAPPSVTAHTALVSLAQLVLVLLGATAALGCLQGVRRGSASIGIVGSKASPVANNNRCLLGIGVLAASTAASGIIRTVNAHHLDASFVELRTQLNDRIAAQVEATPAAMLQLVPYLGQLRTAADHLRAAVLANQAVNLAVAVILFCACILALRENGTLRSGCAMTDAPIQLPPTPPAFETKLGGGQPGFFTRGEIMLAEDAEEVFDDDEEQHRAAKARDDLVLVCGAVGGIALLSVVTSALALVYAAVPELYWAHVTTRRSVDLVVPILAAVVQLAALGFLLTESLQRPRAFDSVEMSSSTGSASPPRRMYQPLSTRMIKRGKSIRWSRLCRGNRRSPGTHADADVEMMTEVSDTDSKTRFVLSDDDGSSSADSRASTPSISDEATSASAAPCAAGVAL